MGERHHGDGGDGGDAGHTGDAGPVERGLAVVLRAMSGDGGEGDDRGDGDDRGEGGLPGAGYPEERPALPPRSRGVIALLEENCTVCMLCARECPDWCIFIDSHKETVTVPGTTRPRQHTVLDRFAIDFALCMYCGICIEVCPFDALFWSPEFEYAAHDVRELTHERDRLREWMWTVPAPPAHDPAGQAPREVTAAAAAEERAARRAGGGA